MKHYRVVIIGGGPSGITCGYLLKRRNEDCLIIDKSKFPREKLCAGGLTPKAYNLINKIYNNLDYDYKTIEKVGIYFNGKKRNTIKLSKSLRTVVRKDFDYSLLKEYLNIGGELINNDIKLIEENKDKIILTLVDDTKLSCDYLVGADGTLSKVRKYINPNSSNGILCLEQHNELYKLDEIMICFDNNFKNGYLFAFPNNKYNAVGYGDKKTNLKEFDNQLNLYNIKSNGKTKGAYVPMLTKINYKFYDNIILIGDAGGYVDSITGEGLYYAIKTGENGALSIINNMCFKKQNKKIINKIKLLRILSIIFYSSIGKVLTKIALKSNWFSTKVINWYLSF